MLILLTLTACAGHIRAIPLSYIPEGTTEEVVSSTSIIDVQATFRHSNALWNQFRAGGKIDVGHLMNPWEL